MPPKTSDNSLVNTFMSPLTDEQFKARKIEKDKEMHRRLIEAIMKNL